MIPEHKARNNCKEQLGSAHCPPNEEGLWTFGMIDTKVPTGTINKISPICENKGIESLVKLVEDNADASVKDFLVYNIQKGKLAG